MKSVVVIKTVPRQLIAAARQRTSYKNVSKEIGPLLSHSWKFLATRPDLNNRGRNVAIYWDGPPDGSVEVGVEIVAPFDDLDTVVCSATPAGTVAACTHIGPYDRLGETHNAVRQWCKDNGHQIAMPSWELYGHWSDDPAKLETDVIYLLA